MDLRQRLIRFSGLAVRSATEPWPSPALLALSGELIDSLRANNTADEYEPEAEVEGGAEAAAAEALIAAERTSGAAAAFPATLGLRQRRAGALPSCSPRGRTCTCATACASGRRSARGQLRALRRAALRTLWRLALREREEAAGIAAAAALAACGFRLRCTHGCCVTPPQQQLMAWERRRRRPLPRL